MLEAPNPNAEFHMPQIRPIPNTGVVVGSLTLPVSMPFSGRANERTSSQQAGKQASKPGSAYLGNVDLPRPQRVYGNMEISDSSIWM